MKGALFDLDGVLIDSEGIYYKFWDSIARDYNVGVPDFAMAIKGTNMASIMAHFAPEDHAEILRRHTEFQQNMRFEFFEGALDFVRILAARGIPRAVVTSSEEGKMQQLYAQHPEFPSLFNAIITGDMVTNGKPHPECYLKGAAAIGCDIRDCYVFEDSLQGIQAGATAGATVVGLTTTYPHEIIAPLAHITIPTLAQASSILNS